MAMTPERIAETEKAVADRPNDLHYLTPDYLTELCRLARLGLKVESAATGLIWPDRGGRDDAALPCPGQYRYCAVSDSEIPRMSRVRLVIE